MDFLNNIPALGASGAVVVVVYLFTQYLKGRDLSYDERDRGLTAVLRENTTALAQNARAFEAWTKVMERVIDRLDNNN